VLNYSHHHLSESTPKIDVVSTSLALAIRRGYRDFLLEEPERQASMKVSSTNFYKNETVVVGIAYKDLHELLVKSHSNSHGHSNSRRLSTIILAVTMDPKADKLKENVSLNFRHLKQVAGVERLCVFWSGFSDKNTDGWSREGCHAVKSTSNAEETECSCNHMTHFAVLFDYSDANSGLTKTDEKILRILTYVGSALSITGVTLTIISYALVTDVHQPLPQIRMSLAGSLGAGQIIFLAGIGATENTSACVTVAALLQYFLMAAFCWMLVEGFHLYLLVVKVYNIENKIRIYHVMSWGLPAVIVPVSLSIASGKDGIHSFVDNKYCWISSNNNLIWIFVTVVMVIEIFNLLILVRVIKEMNTMQPTAGERHNHQIRLSVRACLVMSPLLGITWLFGLLTPLHKAFIYIFTILNSTQGFLIFVLHCVKNNQFRERLQRKLNVIFPAVSDANVGIVGMIEVQPCGGAFELKEL